MARRRSGLLSFPQSPAIARPKPALWHRHPARGRASFAGRDARPADLVRNALARLARTPLRGHSLHCAGLAGELDLAMHRIGQLTTLISVLDRLRGLLVSDQD